MWCRLENCAPSHARHACCSPPSVAGRAGRSRYRHRTAQLHHRVALDPRRQRGGGSRAHLRPCSSWNRRAWSRRSTGSRTPIGCNSRLAFCATSSLMDAQEGSRHRETTVNFDRNRNRAFLTEKDLVKNTIVSKADVQIPNCVHDVIAALMRLRRTKVELGQSVQLPITDGRKSAAVKVEAQEREQVKTPAGTFNTVRYEVNLLNGVVYSRKGRVFVWLTDDDRRLPVQFRAADEFSPGHGHSGAGKRRTSLARRPGEGACDQNRLSYNGADGPRSGRCLPGVDVGRVRPAADVRARSGHLHQVLHPAAQRRSRRGRHGAASQADQSPGCGHRRGSARPGRGPADARGAARAGDRQRQSSGGGSGPAASSAGGDSAAESGRAEEDPGGDHRKSAGLYQEPAEFHLRAGHHPQFRSLRDGILASGRTRSRSSSATWTARKITRSSW